MKNLIVVYGLFLLVAATSCDSNSLDLVPGVKGVMGFSKGTVNTNYIKHHVGGRKYTTITVSIKDSELFKKQNDKDSQMRGSTCAFIFYSSVEGIKDDVDSVIIAVTKEKEVVSYHHSTLDLERYSEALGVIAEYKDFYNSSNATSIIELFDEKVRHVADSTFSSKFKNMRSETGGIISMNTSGFEFSTEVIRAYMEVEFEEIGLRFIHFDVSEDGIYGISF
jgi:hypothetical protein